MVGGARRSARAITIGNVISGNHPGWRVLHFGQGAVTANVVAGNFIGTDVTGTVAPQANIADGVLFVSPALHDNLIGGATHGGGGQRAAATLSPATVQGWRAFGGRWHEW